MFRDVPSSLISSVNTERNPSLSRAKRAPAQDATSNAGRTGVCQPVPQSLLQTLRAFSSLRWLRCSPSSAQTLIIIPRSSGRVVSKFPLANITPKPPTPNHREVVMAATGQKIFKFMSAVNTVPKKLPRLEIKPLKTGNR